MASQFIVYVKSKMKDFLLKSEIQALFRLGKYIFIFMAFYFLATPFHEWAHLLATDFLGGSGYIIQNPWGLGGMMVFTSQPSNLFLVSIAGGVAVAVVFLLVFIFDWYGKNQDLIGAMAILPIITGQLCYGIMEGVCYNMSVAQFMDYGAVAAVIGYGVGFTISLWKTMSYIVKDLWTEKETLKL